MLALLLIPVHFKEPAALIITDTVEKETSVILFTKPLVEDQMFVIKAEGTDVCKTASLKEAFLLLLASYFNFNLRFPGEIEGSLTFLQKVLVGHSDSLKQHAKVSTLLAKLAKA